MSQFDRHTKITKAMSIYLVISHAVVIGTFLVGMTALFGLNYVTLLFIFVGPILGAFGTYLGYSLWKRKAWAFTGCIWFFLLQIVSFETENWAFGLVSGFELFVSIDMPGINVGINFLAAILFVFSIAGKNQFTKYATNNSLHPIPLDVTFFAKGAKKMPSSSTAE